MQEHQLSMPRVPLILTLLGATPFIIQFLLFALQLTDANFVLTLAKLNYYTMHATLAYGFILLIFIAGIDWGLAVQSRGTVGTGVYIWSVFILLCIFAMMAFSFYYIYIFSILAVLYGVVWFGDYVLCRKNYCPHWYLRLRNIITPVVVVSLLGIQAVIYFVKV